LDYVVTSLDIEATLCDGEATIRGKYFCKIEQRSIEKKGE